MTFGCKDDRSAVLAEVCRTLSKGLSAEASGLAQKKYPFERIVQTKRAYSPRQSMRQFLADGFIDRYSGVRLVNPGVIRLLSVLMPEAFPYHPNWKVSETHRVYWELFPTIDHVTPVARGGVDNDSNWVTASMQTNMAKAHWTLDEVGWSLHPPGALTEWDGLTSWFVEYFAANEDRLRNKSYLRNWRRASLQALADLNDQS